MKQFNIEKLERAIVYAERMADGREPYSNQLVDNEVLNNPNVIRAMYFIKDVLQEVKANGGIVGSKPLKKASPTASASLGFPFEVLKQFKYRENKPISYILRDFIKLAGDSGAAIVSAVKVNKWLAANGYLEKVVINDSGKENWAPTDKGIALGLTSEMRGEPGREYIRIEYNQTAQEFLASNLRKITYESLNLKDDSH